MTTTDPRALDPLFRPRSVAVIGASNVPEKIGGRPIAMLKASGFAGRVIPINPGGPTVQGLPAFASLDAVDGPVDVAIVAVPQAAVNDAIDQCARKGVRAVVVFSAGYAEVSEAGAQAQRELAARVRDAGMRMLGPNCMGFANLREGLIATFHPAFTSVMPRTGRLAIVSQSGAFGGIAANLAGERGITFSHMMTTGNEADLQASDCLAWLATDKDTDAILLYLEGCRDGDRLLDALALAHAHRKPVIAIKLGRTDAGARAASSHTAALAGSDAVFDAVFRQYGVYRAESIEEFIDVGCSTVTGRMPVNERVGLVTVSGGVGVLMADAAAARGLDVSPLPEEARRRMKAIVPFAGVENPLDVTGQILADPTLFGQGMDIVLDGGADYGSVVGFLGAAMRTPAFGATLLPTWSRLAAQYPDRHLAIAGIVDDSVRAQLESLGITIFREPTHATRAIAAMRGFVKTHATPLVRPAVPAGMPALPPAPINEVDAMACLRAAGLPTVDQRLVRSADEAAAAATALGLPVVLKIVSPDILHKSDVGGVRVGLATEAAVREAYEAVVARVRAAAPHARIDGCLVAPMVRGGVETIIGVTRDHTFGPVVMFGLGGIFVEALGDVSFRVAPFDVTQAHCMIDEIRGRKVLDGLRGAPPADVGALAQALATLSGFAAAHREHLLSVEANPFVVLERGAVALDAVIEVASRG